MSWRVAKSLLVLKEQIDSMFPRRSKESDGTIGDESHSARSSDHNPNEHGVVCAMDITNDPVNGAASEDIAECLRENRDSRIKYIISNRKIAASYVTGGKPAWSWRSYNGINPHDHHCHISVNASNGDDERKWDLSGLGDKPKGEPISDPALITLPTLRKGSKNSSDVGRLQSLLNKRGFTIAFDGSFGPKTLAAVKQFQKDNDLVVDGVVGPQTWRALNAEGSK